MECKLLPWFPVTSDNVTTMFFYGQPVSQTWSIPQLTSVWDPSSWCFPHEDAEGLAAALRACWTSSLPKQRP
jgi:hypothetical protein